MATVSNAGNHFEADLVGMIFFNLRGIGGMLLGCIVAVFLVILPPLQLDAAQQWCYGFLIATLVASCYALLTDRSDRHGLWESYRVNCIAFYYPLLGQLIPGDVGWNNRRRTAVFLWPLAFGPLVPLFVCLFCWPIDRFQQLNLVTFNDYRDYAVCSSLSVVLAGVFAWRTRDLRWLPDAAAETETSDDWIDTHPASTPGGIAKFIRGESTPENPDRRMSLLFSLIGGFGMVVTYLFLDRRQPVAGLLMLLCPMALFLGLGGLVDPRIAWSIRGEGKHYPLPVRFAGAILALSGLAVGILTIFWK